jgi:hypothetical protein
MEHRRIVVTTDYTFSVAGFAVEAFERQAEAYLQSRSWRQLQVLAGNRLDLGLGQLYYEDFADLTSYDHFADLRGAEVENLRQHHHLVALAAAALLEARTVSLAERAVLFESGDELSADGSDVRWRLAPERWRLLAETSQRHDLQDAWLRHLETGASPVLDRWQADLLDLAARRLAVDDLVSFWDEQRELQLSDLNRQAVTLLETSAELFGHVLGTYLGQFELPIDDVWRCDVDWAFRAAQFDAYFPSLRLMPVVVGTLHDLGIDLEAQSGLHLDLAARDAKAGGVHCVSIGVPEEVHVLLRPIGGHTDYQRLLRGIGMAQHTLCTDRTLPFSQRRLGDASVTLASGLLLERLTFQPEWLAERLDFSGHEDYRIVAHLAWLARVRAAAAELEFEHGLWRGGPEAGGLSGDYQDAMSRALRLRPFGGERYALLLGAPWSTLSSATWLRAELFAAQAVAYLRREFDSEWWQSPRAARFIVQELWRPGRRHTAEELLAFMGYEGFDSTVLWADIDEVLRLV